MNILLVDDEPLARARLKRLLQAFAEHQVVGEASDGDTALALAGSLQPDLVFLDIQMPGRDGLSVAGELLHLPLPPAVVFLTAHPQHALEAYQVAPAGYLLKPVSPEQLAATLQRIGLTTKAHLQKQQAQQWLSYKSGNTLQRVELQQMFYLQAEDKYVRFVFAGGEALSDLSLKQLEEQFPQDLIRIHRNTLVLKRRIKALHLQEGKHLLELWQCAQRLEVSRRELPKIRQLLSGA